MFPIDQTVTLQATDKDGALIQEYYFGFLPYKFMQRFDRWKPCYDSHCYVGIKYSGTTAKVNFKNWKYNDYSYTTNIGELIIAPMKTNYCPDLRLSEEEKIKRKAMFSVKTKQAIKEIQL